MFLADCMLHCRLHFVRILPAQDDVDADDGDDDDAAADAQLEEDDAYMKRLRKQALKMLRGETAEDDDDSEDEWSEDGEEAIGTPLDDIDPFISFAEVLGQMQGSMPGRYQALVSGADAGVMSALQGMSEYAAQIKQKKAAEAAAQQ
jgi:hypothetical protein